MRRLGQPLAQRLHEARLPDARIARDDHHLAESVLHLLPASEQEPELLLAPDERGQLLGRRHVESAAHAARPQRLVHAHGLANALQRSRPQIAGDEDSLHETKRRGGEHDGVGPASSWSRAARFVVSAHRQHLVARAASHAAHDDEARMDADAHRQP